MLNPVSTLSELLAPLDQEARNEVSERLLRPGIEGVVLFEGASLADRAVVARKAHVFGPAAGAIKALPEPDAFLGSEPETRLYATRYYLKPTLPGPEAVS